MSILFATLNPDGTLSNQRTLSHDSIGRCRFSIMVADHYRDDGTCKCDDRDHRAMMVREWEYPEDAFEGIPLRDDAPVRKSPAPGDAPTAAMTGDRLDGDHDALLVSRRWSQPFADLKVCYRLFMAGSFEQPDAVSDFLAMRLDHATGEWVVALHAAYRHDGKDVLTVAQRRALAEADSADFGDKLATALRGLRKAQ